MRERELTPEQWCILLGCAAFRGVTVERLIDDLPRIIASEATATQAIRAFTHGDSTDVIDDATGEGRR